MALKKVGNIYQNSGGLKKVGNIKDGINPKQQAPQQQGGAWNTFTRNIIKPVASASNLLEDVSKIGGYGIAKLGGYKGDFSQAAKQADIAPWQHQKDVWAGRNQRTYSDIMGEIGNQQNSPVLKNAMKTVGYGGDFLLDPLNKLKILGLTGKGNTAIKTGKLGLSAGEQASKGERALLQFGRLKTPQVIDKAVLGGTTKLNDLIRGTKYGGKLADVGSAMSSKIRPAGISRAEFKTLTDAKTAARNLTGYTQDKAVDFAKGLAKTLKNRKVTQAERASLLHAIEKGNEKLAPAHLKDIFKQGVEFKTSNENLWKKLGGATLEGHGLSHVATKEVAEAARKDSFKGGGFKLTSTQTPQDIHRKYARVDGKIVNMKDKGIIYDPVKGYLEPRAIEFKPGQYRNSYQPVRVEQASAMEINNAMEKAGKKAIFQEDLPIVAAKMGISTGRKQAGVEFLEATKGLKGDVAKKLANETYEKMTNNESVRKAIEMFDKVQNIWKAQALLGPSYHVRNMAGNFWNNYLADVKTFAYAKAAKLQNTKNLSKAERALVKEMEQHGVIGTGQFTGDIAEAIESQIGTKSFNPFSQKFFAYRGNRKLGSAIEDNAKIAHYLSKKAEGYGAKQAAESVKKYLFDYGDLTKAEQGLLKRVLPFYTWTSKNVPLQVQQFIENPGKFSKIGTAKKDIEQGVPETNEKFMSDYIKDNGPIRYKTEDGVTKYFLLGSWLPAAAAMQVLSKPLETVIGQTSPLAKLPFEQITGKGTFFKDTLGNYQDVKSYPGQKRSYLGLDLEPMTTNYLRSIRPLNELDQLNPGEIFGAKNKPSIFQGILDNASNQRGGRFTPESTQTDRILERFMGKSQNYDPNYAKTFYDRDTASRVSEFDTAIKQAMKNKQVSLAEKLVEQKKQFLQERNGQQQKSTNPFYQ